MKQWDMTPRRKREKNSWRIWWKNYLRKKRSKNNVSGNMGQ